jgi:RHS repeat-associated protein
MPLAAKEENLSPFGDPCVFFSLAAFDDLAENSRPGFERKNLSSSQGGAWTNSASALGIREVLLETRVKYRCTGKERDSESGLDNFGARYDSSNIGRFMSPDPILIMPQKLTDPQQWNLYSYVRNNPLNFTDPTGMYTVSCNDGDKKCAAAAVDFEKHRQNDLKSKNDQVRDAAKAWGDPNTKNGVTVTFKSQQQMDKENNVPAGDHVTSIVKPGQTADHQADIQATFSESVKGSDLDQLIAHEGTHVGDDLFFLNSFDGSAGKYNAEFNMTVGSSEFRGFAVGAQVKPYNGLQCGGVTCTIVAGPNGFKDLGRYLTTTPAYSNHLSTPIFDPSKYPQQ